MCDSGQLYARRRIIQSIPNHLEFNEDCLIIKRRIK